MISVAPEVPHASAMCPSMPHVSAHLSCLSVPPISAASQCCLSVPYISVLYQCCLSVPISDACQCPSVQPTSASSLVPPISVHQ
ncbi:unnamed protein product, partial [Staurois parvus]